MLPFITSPVTTAVMEWINADVQRRRCWLERAEQSLSQADRSAAIASLAASLCDEIKASVAQQVCPLVERSNIDAVSRLIA